MHPRDCDGGLSEQHGSASGVNMDDHERYRRERCCRKPTINVNAYIIADEVINAEVCDVDLNPISVRIGAQYDTTQVNLHMSIPQAERLMIALQQCLQDRYTVANGEPQ